MSQQTPTISPEVAQHVLWAFDRGGYEPGSFTQHLLRAFATADLINFHQLEAAYPEYASAVAGAQNDPAGIANLQRLANGGPIACATCGDTDGPFDRQNGTWLCEVHAA